MQGKGFSYEAVCIWLGMTDCDTIGMARRRRMED
jgi:hypothetical protein